MTHRHARRQKQLNFVYKTSGLRAPSAPGPLGSGRGLRPRPEHPAATKFETDVGARSLRSLASRRYKVREVVLGLGRFAPSHPPLPSSSNGAARECQKSLSHRFIFHLPPIGPQRVQPPYSPAPMYNSRFYCHNNAHAPHAPTHVVKEPCGRKKSASYACANSAGRGGLAQLIVVAV